MSYLFGPEVEDYRTLLTRVAMAHETVPEIFMVTNMVPGSRPPPKRPDPPLTADGKLPVQYPHRVGWHTDQSYRRPPPDISLFYRRDAGRARALARRSSPRAISPTTRCRPISGRRSRRLEGLHAQPGQRPQPQRRRVRQAAARRAAAPALAEAAGGARPSGDRQEGALSLRGRPDGLVRRPVRRHGTGPARRRRESCSTS
jgi:hypothetical protein